jgi:hypothetical protein
VALSRTLPVVVPDFRKLESTEFSNQFGEHLLICSKVEIGPHAYTTVIPRPFSLLSKKQSWIKMRSNTLS